MSWLNLMKTFLRLLVVFGLLDLLVAAVEFFSGNAVSAKVILGVIVLAIGSTGLYLMKSRAQDQ